MKFKDLLELPFKEVLENYVILFSPECGYYYGISEASLVEDLFNEYNIEEDYPEAFDVDSIIPDEAFIDYEDDLINYAKFERIMDNLGISKKGEK